MLSSQGLEAVIITIAFAIITIMIVITTVAIPAAGRKNSEYITVYHKHPPSRRSSRRSNMIIEGVEVVV